MKLNVGKRINLFNLLLFNQFRLQSVFEMKYPDSYKKHRALFMRTAPYCSHSLHFSSSQTGRRAPPSISFWQRSAAGGWPGAFGSRCGVFCGTDPNTGTIPRSVLHAPPPTRRSGLFAPLPSHSSRHNRKLPSGGTSRAHTGPRSFDRNSCIGIHPEGPRSDALRRSGISVREAFHPP